MLFTEKKFFSLSFATQHKKCAELIERIYAKLTPLEEYEKLCEWMQLPPVKSSEELSNRFHWHLAQCKGRRKEHRLLPSIRENDTLNPKAALLPIAIYLDHIRSAHNVGSIIRTTETLHLGTLYFSDQTPSPDHLQVKKTAMGTDSWVSWKKCQSLDQLPRPIIALETSDEAQPIETFTFPTTFTLVVGNEEYGCSKEVLNCADYLVTIPTYGRKNSLNVANAFAIAAYQIRRQAAGSIT